MSTEGKERPRDGKDIFNYVWHVVMTQSHVNNIPTKSLNKNRFSFMLPAGDNPKTDLGAWGIRDLGSDKSSYCFLFHQLTGLLH
jgi:hypothetical protein